MRKVSVGHALLVTLFVTSALLGVQFAGFRLAGLPFSPFDLTDALTRSGFGPWVGVVQSALSFFGRDGRSQAQALALTEWALALALFAALALLAGLLVWMVLGRRHTVPDALDGATVGVAWGVPMMILAVFASRSLIDPVLIIVWILGLYTIWGLVHAMAYRQLMRSAAIPPLQSELVADGEADEASESTPELDGAAALRVDRRRFLFQLGASTAAITAVSATAGALLGSDQPDPRLRPPFPVAGDTLRSTQARLLANFRRFAIVRFPPDDPAAMSVVALGAEYPDHHYVTVWLGDGSPIVVYESLETVLGAYNTLDSITDFLWLDS